MSALAPAPTDEDFGLFGPSSLTWRVHLEPVLWVAGFRALYLQALHPQVMRGTAQNSALFDRDRAWQRFQRTAEFVAIRTFGTTEEVAQAGRRVRRLHARLRGHDPDTGAQFRIDDPEYLLWVHCGEIDSYVNVARRAGILTSTGEADAYLAESRRAAQVVGLPAEQAPASSAELANYFTRMRPKLYACPQARQALLRSLNPPVPLPPLLRPLKLAMPAFVALSFAVLPPWARRLYGAPGLPTTDLAATLALRALRQVSTVLPDSPRAQRARHLIHLAQRSPAAVPSATD
ncbi:MAG TPA: oxygenase MpaB family protein [Pseudonocardiaceae bacterium]|nr:oxygenase MpaB family protein [Pseudonocardiaceae bacterium]